MRPGPVEATREYLRALVALHAGAEPDEERIARLARPGQVVVVPAGEVVFREGDPADAALLVVRGLLRASVAGPDGERDVGEIGPWEIVGETALVAPEAPRTATVRAVSEATCLRLRPDDLEEDDPVSAALELLLVHALAARLRATSLAVGGEAP